jgi:fatty acyl-CoA reductase
MDEKPEMMKKIYPIWGDVTIPNFGLNSDHLNRVAETTDIMFHLAASLKLEATLKPNIIMNLLGTKYAIDLAKQMKNLIQMVHLSTAFCNVEPEIAEEKVYDFHHDPLELIRCSEWMSEEAMAAMQKEILGIHPNTYTYTKRLAEILVRDEYNNSSLPVCIVRPSIVCPAFQEPLPGWVCIFNYNTFLKSSAI